MYQYNSTSCSFTYNKASSHNMVGAVGFSKYRLLIVSAATKSGVYVRQHVSAPPATNILRENRSVWIILWFKTFGGQLVSDNRELIDSVYIPTRTLQQSTVNPSRLKAVSSRTSQHNTCVQQTWHSPEQHR